MSRNIQNEKRTLAYVLRRTNYGEADRIINLITPDGKVSVIAKGVRKEKSKLAGNIELFSLIDINVHFGKNELGVLTSAKMLKFYSKIMTDFKKMELAGLILKKISVAAEASDNQDFFKIVDECLAALDADIDTDLVEAWFLLNYQRALGEEINLYRDSNGRKLEAEKRYSWDRIENCLVIDENGEIAADEIKVLRLILTSGFSVIGRIKNMNDFLPKILYIARSVNKI